MHYLCSDMVDVYLSTMLLDLKINGIDFEHYPVNDQNLRIFDTLFMT